MCPERPKWWFEPETDEIQYTDEELQMMSDQYLKDKETLMIDEEEMYAKYRL